MRILKIFAWTIVMQFIGCRKEQLEPIVPEEVKHTDIIKGLPKDLTKMNGYFYIVQSPSSDSNTYARTTFALFAAQGGDLRKGYNRDLDFWSGFIAGDLDMGKLKLDTFTL